MLMKDRIEKPREPNLIPTESKWMSMSGKWFYKRSEKLKAIDEAVKNYNEAKGESKDYKARYKLSEELLTKIRAWKGTKKNGDKLESKRIDAVDKLGKDAEQERAALARLDSTDSTPTHLAVYSMGALIKNDGSFDGKTQQEYETLQQDNPKDSEIALRIRMLKSKLKEASQHLETEGKDTYGLFTVPEWFFKQKGTLFSEDQKVQI